MTSLSFLCQRLALSEEQLCMPDEGTHTHIALSHTLLIDFGICEHFVVLSKFEEIVSFEFF